MLTQEQVHAWRLKAGTTPTGMAVKINFGLPPEITESHSYAQLKRAVEAVTYEEMRNRFSASCVTAMTYPSYRTGGLTVREIVVKELRMLAMNLSDDFVGTLTSTVSPFGTVSIEIKRVDRFEY